MDRHRPPGSSVLEASAETPMTRDGVSAQLNAANLVTTASLVVGATGCMVAIEGDPRVAVLLGILCLPLDILDGVLARRFETSGPFGAALDNLADLVAFGMLPAAIAAASGVEGTARVGLALYVAAVGWRLAWFSTRGTVERGGRRFYRGMTAPYVAALVYVALGLSRWLLPGYTASTLLVVLGVAPFLLLGGFAFPKTGWHMRLMWLLLPIAAYLQWSAVP